MLEKGLSSEMPEYASAPRKRLVTTPSMMTATTPVSSVTISDTDVDAYMRAMLSDACSVFRFFDKALSSIGLLRASGFEKGGAPLLLRQSSAALGNISPRTA